MSYDLLLVSAMPPAPTHTDNIKPHHIYHRQYTQTAMAATAMNKDNQKHCAGSERVSPQVENPIQSHHSNGR